MRLKQISDCRFTPRYPFGTEHIRIEAPFPFKRECKSFHLRSRLAPICLTEGSQTGRARHQSRYSSSSTGITRSSLPSTAPPCMAIRTSLPPRRRLKYHISRLIAAARPTSASRATTAKGPPTTTAADWTVPLPPKRIRTAAIVPISAASTDRRNTEDDP